MRHKTALPKRSLHERHALVCGGSQGIGRETAGEIVRRGGSVCLLGRDAARLEQTAVELRAQTEGSRQFVDTLVADARDQQALATGVDDYIARRGVPDYLLNLVGFAQPGYVSEFSLDDYRAGMDTNYYGQLVPTLVLLPHMLARGRGHIAFVSSMMGYFGIVGYATYAPTKFALVGLAEALRHELKPRHITFSVLYPPDTDTPGFARENRSKPVECAALSATISPMSAAEVARVFVDGLVKKQFAIHPGQSAWVWRVQRHFPWLLRWFNDRAYTAARRRKGGD